MKQRLKIIAAMVPDGCTAADIGTDHGFLPIELVLSGKCIRAIAMDIAPGPLEQAVKHIKEAGLEDKIECRLSDGFDGLKINEVDVAVIAGMGGDLMSEIICRKPETADMLILSPHTHSEKVRAALRCNGFTIIDERMMAEADKYYVFIKAVRKSGQEDACNPQELLLYDYFGKLLIERHDPVLLQYLLKEQEKFSGITQKAEYVKILKKALSAMM